MATILVARHLLSASDDAGISYAGTSAGRGNISPEELCRQLDRIRPDADPEAEHYVLQEYWDNNVDYIVWRLDAESWAEARSDLDLYDALLRGDTVGYVTVY